MNDSPVHVAAAISTDAPAHQTPPDARRPGHRHGSSPTSLSPYRVVLAWVLSLGAHGLLLALMFAVVFPFSTTDKEAPPPDVRVRIVGHHDAPVSSPHHTMETPSDRVPVDGAPVRFEPIPMDVRPHAVAPESAELHIVGLGSGGGDFGALGLSIGGGAGPEFFGVGSTARAAERIVYVVDRSGSMVDTFEFVRQELKRSISAMRRSQKFHIIFFSSGAVVENPPKKLVHAIEVNKQEAFAFLQTVSTGGGTQPEGALARAFDLEPDLIYLLSDGVDFDPSLLEKLNEWNHGRLVQICTIAYVDPGGRHILERIAREHHGEFRFVSEYELP